MNQVLFQIFKIIIKEYTIKKHKAITDNLSIRIHISRIENRISFEIKSRDHLEILTFETMKLLRSSEKTATTTTKKTRNKNGKIVPYLEITAVILIYGNIVNKCYQQNSRVLYTFILKKPSGQLLEI